MKQYTEAERADIATECRRAIYEAKSKDASYRTLARGAIAEVALAALEANPVVVPEGWKLVPIKPTDEMCKAAYEARDKWSSMQCDNQREMHYSFAEPRYKAMLKAAPVYGGEVEGE